MQTSSTCTRDLTSGSESTGLAQPPTPPVVTPMPSCSRVPARWSEPRPEVQLEQRLDALAKEADRTREDLAAMFAKRGTPIGTYAQLREQFSTLEGLGITRFYLQGGYDPDHTPELVEAVIR